MREWDKQRTLGLLKARGICRVILEFSGGNDEGGVDDAKFYAPVKAEPDIRGALKLEPATEVELFLLPTDSALQEAGEDSVYSVYYSFAGEYQVEGTVTFDVEAGTVVMVVNQSEQVWREETKEL